MISETFMFTTDTYICIVYYVAYRELRNFACCYLWCLRMKTLWPSSRGACMPSTHTAIASLSGNTNGFLVRALPHTKQQAVGKRQ